jgi:uncharacterized membrane protein
VFIKLKWLGRVVGLLTVALFLLTEAVPVFVGALIVWAIVFVMSVFHAQDSMFYLGNKLFAISLVCFGLITVMPVISAMGLIYWMNIPEVKFWHQFKALL